MSETTEATRTRATRTEHVYRVYIRATPEAIWAAITKPEWTERYGYGTRSEFDLRPGGAFRSFANAEMQQVGMPEVVVSGEVVEADPPRRLVQTWLPAWEPGAATRLTYEIKEGVGGVCTLTVTHELTGAPETDAMVTGQREAEGAGGGWAWVLSDLKTLLETGKGLQG
jgi:uncharacterized protein YndB with AHSA1/START domain